MEIPAEQLAGDNRDKALEVPEGVESYGSVQWPQGSGESIEVGGQPVDVGEIRVKKTKLQNLSALVGPCEEGATIDVTLAQSNLGPVVLPVATKDITCGSGFQVLNIPDGQFTLYASQDSPKTRRVWQTIDPLAPSPLRLNLAAFVSLQIGVEVDGRTLDDLPPGLKLSLKPRDPELGSQVLDQVSTGAFEATIYPGERYSITALSPPNYYLKRIIYGGTGQPSSSEFTASTAPASQLGIVLSNHAASVQVHVTSGGNPRSGLVFLIREGITAAELSHGLLQNLGFSDAFRQRDVSRAFARDLSRGCPRPQQRRA